MRKHDQVSVLYQIIEKSYYHKLSAGGKAFEFSAQYGKKGKRNPAGDILAFSEQTKLCPGRGRAYLDTCPL